jgi:Kef-type K+ transport system membrane component KefB
VRIAGRIGVAFLLLEAGLHMDAKIVRELGLRALGLTVAGMSAPLAGAIAVMYCLGYDDFLQAFAVGARCRPYSPHR